MSGSKVGLDDGGADCAGETDGLTAAVGVH
jgi:hypothetical protein